MERRRSAVRLAGAVAVVVGGAIAVRMASWLVADGIVETGSGAELADPARALAAIAPAVMAVTVGAIVLICRRRVASGRLFVVLIALTAALVVAAPVGMAHYPTSSHARITALDPRTGATRWTATVPVTDLWGIRSMTSTALVVEGSRWHRICGWDHVSVRIDRATGRVIGTTRLPSWYPNADAVPPQPAKPSPTEFVFENGHHAVICSS